VGEEGGGVSRHSFGVDGGVEVLPLLPGLRKGGWDLFASTHSPLHKSKKRLYLRKPTGVNEHAG
jgi:hypothetical protein